ncbi:26S proteasome non-ATPase regulatory subunit 4 homolog isoform X2 [Papaver somniferum]|uniref:26S proteasome non-ATPase regulatory subunit 4 homolog isoform X2 n=1 Tax=Papaver somniferum TaxID=3469 RepID=UPI000E6F9EBB|nr:26S proteasome non-ATPase regulatory subunit 4 homolog isoform X2 [Papaver somniferum]
MIWQATMICIDNSEWMRNGDYSPTRFQAQAEAVSLLCGAKTQSNPENTVGVLAMAGKGVRVLVTPTTDLGKVLACMHGLEMGGEMNLAAGIQVAQLALKHRQNKNQQQRIIIFPGGPVKYDKKVLESIGKKLKKNSVALDIVDFGEEADEKAEKLEALHAAVNNGNSHIVHVPPESSALCDVLLTTPIFTGDGEGGSAFAASAAAAAAGGAAGYEFGVDPNLDPELALALRASMEEERARQEAAARAAEEKGGGQASSSHDTTMIENTGIMSHGANTGDLMDDDTALLEQALAMSLNDHQSIPSGGISLEDTDMSEATKEDQELALALQMSTQGNAEAPTDQSEINQVLGNQAYVSSILSTLPGVDTNDDTIQDLIASLRSHQEKLNKEYGDKPPNDK